MHWFDNFSGSCKKTSGLKKKYDLNMHASREINVLKPH